MNLPKPVAFEVAIDLTEDLGQLEVVHMAFVVAALVPEPRAEGLVVFSLLPFSPTLLHLLQEISCLAVTSPGHPSRWLPCNLQDDMAAFPKYIIRVSCTS